MKMKKKIICIFVCILLIAVVIPTAGSANKNYVTKESKKINTDDECKCKKIEEDTNDNQDFLLYDYPVMTEIPEFPNPSTESPKPTIIDTPDYFSWKNYNGEDWTTPARHQGNCGSCWAFAALSSFESMIKIRENCPDLNPDLSEQYVLSCINGAGSCHGGSTTQALELLMGTTPEGNNQNGVIHESCFPYEADDDIPCNEKCQTWEETLVPIMNYGYWSGGDEESREQIKSQIIQNGPVATHIKATDPFKIWGGLNHNPNSYYPYLKPVVGLNHVVIIVGWKDDSLIRNGGYWICKNSWGTDWGYDGFFNIEYTSLNIDQFLIVWTDYDPESYDWAPLSNPGGPYSADDGEEITFDASKSIGYEGEIISYEWDFGDESTGSGITTTHTYSQQEEYIVTLTVTDSKGNYASQTTWARIQESSNNAPEKPTVTGPASGTSGEEYEFRVITTDSNGDDVYYRINWDEGNQYEYELEAYKSGEEAVFHHTWDYKGTYNIEVTAMDIYGAESEIGTLVTTMPRNRVINNPIQNLFKLLPYKFSLLLYLIKIKF